jgi:hypothetical protein
MLEMFTLQMSTGREITVCKDCLEDWKQRFGLRRFAPETKKGVSCSVCRRRQEDDARNDCFQAAAAA